mgnify:CR=1 FL=1|jgi:hypothetical protein
MSADIDLFDHKETNESNLNQYQADKLDESSVHMIHIPTSEMRNVE